MDFRPNISLNEVIKKRAFGETYFRNIYFSVTDEWYETSFREFDVLEDIDQNYYCLNYYDVSVNKYGVKCVTSLRFWENKGWINPMDPYCWFQWYFRYWIGRRSVDDEREINRWKRNVTRFKGKLVKMIKDANSRFDYYSILPKIRQPKIIELRI